MAFGHWFSEYVIFYFNQKRRSETVCTHVMNSYTDLVLPSSPKAGQRAASAPSVTTFLLCVTRHQKKPLVPKSNGLMEMANGLNKQSPRASPGSERTVCLRRGPGASRAREGSKHRFHLYFKTCARMFRRRQWHPTPVLLPGKSHGQRSLVGCSPWGR